MLTAESEADTSCIRQDLRSSRCLQTIDEANWHAPEDARPATLMYDSARHQLVTAAHRPVAWAQVSASDTLTAHVEPLVAALYNTLFHVVRKQLLGLLFAPVHAATSSNVHPCHCSNAYALLQVVTCDEGGCVFLWNALTGRCAGSYAHAHGHARLTAATFDEQERRLVTAGSDGGVHVWSAMPTIDRMA